MAIAETDHQETLTRVRAALATRDSAALRTLLARLPPARLSRVFADLSRSEVSAILHVLGTEQVAELVADLDPTQAAELLLRISRPQAADILEEMNPDDATDVVEELRPTEAEAILEEMARPEAGEIRELLSYPPETAGGRMTPEFIAVSPDLTVEEAIEAIRELAPEAETVYYVYVTDEQERLIGVLSLRELVLAKPRTPVRRVMVSDPIRVNVTDDQEVVAQRLTDHGLLAIPVVDDADHLLGIVTADDVADILEQEATEDIARFGGQVPLEEPYLDASVLDVVRKRVVWLLVLFLAQAYTSTVLQYFADELATLVALAFFIPLLIGTGGNVGSQTVTTVVRAMAVGELGLGDFARVLQKELVVGGLLGLVMGGTALLRAWTMGVTADLGLVVAISAVFVVVWAAMVAAVLPLILRRLGVDPAVVSAPLITTLVDGTGLFIYLSLARVLLSL